MVGIARNEFKSVQYRQMCDQICVMKTGKLVEERDTESLFTHRAKNWKSVRLIERWNLKRRRYEMEALHLNSLKEMNSQESQAIGACILPFPRTWRTASLQSLTRISLFQNLVTSKFQNRLRACTNFYRCSSITSHRPLNKPVREFNFIKQKK